MSALQFFLVWLLGFLSLFIAYFLLFTGLGVLRRLNWIGMDVANKVCDRL